MKFMKAFDNFFVKPNTYSETDISTEATKRRMIFVIFESVIDFRLHTGIMCYFFAFILGSYPTKSIVVSMKLYMIPL